MTQSQKIATYGLAADSFRMIVGATSVAYLLACGVTLSELGVMKAMQAAIIMVLAVPLGYMADHMGRRKVIVLAVVSTALWLGLTGWGTSLAIFFIAEVFNAIGIAAFNGAFSAILLDAYQRESGRADYEDILGWYEKWQFLLMGVAALLGAIAGGHATPFAWQLACVLTASLCMTTWWMIPETTLTRSTVPQRLSDDFRLIRDALASSPRASYLFLGQIGVLLCSQLLIQFWQPLLSSASIGITPGWLYGGSFVLFLLAQSAASEHARKIPLSSPLYLLGGSLALMSIIFVFTDAVRSVSILIALITVLFYVFKRFSIASSAEIHRIVPASLWSTVGSTVSMLMRLLFIATLPIIGFAADGDATVTLLVLGVGLVLSIGLIAAQHRKQSVKQHPT